MAYYASQQAINESLQDTYESYFTPRNRNSLRPLESLDTLENDEEYAQTAERFLKGINEGGTVDDLYEYFRDADWNLADGAYRAFQELPNLTEQQKSDYRYLKNRFDNADMGGFNQYVKAAGDIGIDMITDPSLLVSALFAPVTGGSSLAARAALAKTAQLGLKQVGKSFVQDKPLTQTLREVGLMNVRGGTRKARTERLRAIKDYYNTEVKNTAMIGAAEGAIWDGAHTYLAQERDDVDGIDLRQGLDYYDIGLNTAFGTFLGGALGGALTKGIQSLPLSEARQNILRFSDETSLQDSDLIYKVNKAKDIFLANTIGKPTTRFLTMAQDSETLKELMKKFRYDAFKGKEDSPDSAKFLGRSYKQELDDYAGKYNVAFEDSLGPLMKRNGKMSKTDEDILFRLMQTPEDRWDKAIPDANDIHKDAARGVRVVADMVLKDGNDVGIIRRKLRKGPNDWMPRRWRWSVVSERRDELANILVDEGAVTLPYDTVVKYLPKEKQKQMYRLERISNEYNNLINEFETLPAVEVQKKIKRFQQLVEPEVPANIYSRVNWKDVKFHSLGQIIDQVEESRKKIVTKFLPDTKEVRREKLKIADMMIEDMLDKKNLVDTLDLETLGTMAPSSFSPRSLFMVDDSKIRDFVDNDFNLLMKDYFNSSARLFARTKTLGVNVQDFKNRWIGDIRDPNSIRGQLHAAGKPLSSKDAQELQSLYEYATGLGKQYFDASAANHIADFAKVSQQVAHLPLATLSSLTEILIPLTRVGGGEYIKALGKTIKNATEQQFNGTKKLLQEEHNLTSDEAYREMHRVYLALEQAVAQRVDSLTGEGIQSVSGRKIQENFFKYTGLSGWTRTVQLAAFTMGKDLIRRNLDTVVELGNLAKSSKSDKRKYKRAVQELADLGVNIPLGKIWLTERKGNMYNKEQRANERTGLHAWDEYYENNVMQGAARFANEVILDPSKAAVTRPHIQQHPAGTVLFQFMGYPTAFANTVLKNFLIQMKRDPVTGSGKVLSTALLMTGVAAGINAVRSNGECLDKEYPEIISDAVSRWGGLGYAEYLVNIRKNQEYGSGLLGSVAKGVSGPIVGDVVDMMLYRKGLGEMATTNVPFYSALDTASFLAGKTTGEELDFKKDVKGFGRDIDYEVGVRMGTTKPKQYPSPYAAYARPYRQYQKAYEGYVEGGEVYHKVDNASSNPSNKIDPYTQLPYNVTAGVIIDEEPRQRYSLGRIVRSGIETFAEESNFSLDQILNDSIYKSVTPYLKRLQFQPKESTIKNIDSGNILQVNPNETNRYVDIFTEDSVEKATVNLSKSTNKESPMYGYRVNLAGEGTEGKARVRNPFEWEGDVQDSPVFLLWDDKFLNEIEKRKHLSSPIYKDKVFPDVPEEKDIRRLEETGTKVTSKINEIKKFKSLQADLAGVLNDVYKMDFENSIFDQDEVIETILDGFNREFIKLMEDEGYDSIKYYGQALTDPDTIKVIDLSRRKDYIIDDYGDLVDVGISKDLENIAPPTTAGGRGTRFLTADTQGAVQRAVDKYNIEGDDAPEFEAEEVSFGGLEDSNIKRTAMGDALLQAKIDTMGKQTGYRMVKSPDEKDDFLLPESEEELEKWLASLKTVEDQKEAYRYFEDTTKDPKRADATGRGLKIGLAEDVEKAGYIEPEKGSDPTRDLKIDEDDIELEEEVELWEIDGSDPKYWERRKSSKPLAYEYIVRANSKTNRNALSPEMKKNPNYLLFHKEQFYDTESYSSPTKKEINLINNETSVEERTDLLNSYTVQKVSKRIFENVLNKGENLNLVSVGSNALPSGKIISYKLLSDGYIKGLMQNLDVDAIYRGGQLEDIDQVMEVIALQDNYEHYKKMVKEIDFPEVAYARVDTIPGQEKQIIYSSLQTKDQIIEALTNPSVDNPSEFWMLPPDNDVFSPEARIWRLINIEKEDLSTTLSPNALTKHANDSVTIDKTETTLDNSTMISGGARGADKIWGDIGLEYGLDPSNIKHYYVKNQKEPYGNFELSYEKANEADSYIRQANKTLGRTYPTKSTATNNKFRRTLHNIKDSDAVFAVTELEKGKKTVKGGTAWGVQMAIDLSKPTYVFDQNIKSWHIWNRDKKQFMPTETPRLTKIFAGIGARDLTEAGAQAIRDVYEKSSKEGVQIVPQLLSNQGRKRFVAFDYTPDGKLLGIEGRGRREALEEFILEEQQRGTPEIDKEMEPYMFRSKTTKSPVDLGSRVYAPIPRDWQQPPEIEGLTELENFAIAMNNLYKATGGNYGTNLPMKDLLRGKNKGIDLPKGSVKKALTKKEEDIEIPQPPNKKDEELIKSIAAEPDVEDKLPRDLDPPMPKVKTSRSLLNRRLNKELYNKSELKSALGLEKIPSSYYTKGNRGVKDIADLAEYFSEEGIPHPEGLDPYDSANWDLNSILKSIEDNEPVFNDQGKLEAWERLTLEAEQNIRLLEDNGFDPLKMKNKDIAKTLANFLFKDTRTNYRGGSLVSVLQNRFGEPSMKIEKLRGGEPEEIYLEFGKKNIKPDVRGRRYPKDSHLPAQQYRPSQTLTDSMGQKWEDTPANKESIRIENDNASKIATYFQDWDNKRHEEHIRNMSNEEFLNSYGLEARREKVIGDMHTKANEKPYYTSRDVIENFNDSSLPLQDFIDAKVIENDILNARNKQKALTINEWQKWSQNRFGLNSGGYMLNRLKRKVA